MERTQGVQKNNHGHNIKHFPVYNFLVATTFTLQFGTVLGLPATQPVPVPHPEPARGPWLVPLYPVG